MKNQIPVTNGGGNHPGSGERMKISRGSTRLWICLGLVAWLMGQATVAFAFELRLIHRPESVTGPFELLWEATPGRSYDILATPELGQEWKPALEAPLVVNGTVGSWVDTVIGSARFYLVVERPVDVPQELPLDALEVLPARANLSPGGRQTFRVSTAGGDPVTWSIAAAGSNAQVGTLGADGVYVAPTTLPEIPVLLVRATRAGNPVKSGYAVVTLQADDELELTREQAIEVVKIEVIAGLNSPGDAAAFGLHGVVGPEDRIQPYRPPGDDSGSSSTGRELRGSAGGSWYLLVDEAPLSGWVHPVIHVLVDARTGALTRQPDPWYALLNGQPLWGRISDRLQSAEVVHMGERLRADLLPPPGAPAASGTSRTAARPAAASPAPAEVPPIPRTFLPDPDACPCVGGTRYHAVIAALSPEESALVRSARAMEAVLAGNRFSVTTLTFGGASRLVSTLDGLRSKIRPCDVLVVMVLGHGIHGGVQGMGPGEWVRAFRAIPTNARYLIVEACDAGWLIDDYKVSDHAFGTPTATILTASNKELLDGKVPFVGTSPINSWKTLLGGTSLFTDALIACFSRQDALEDIHACLTSILEIGPAAVRLKLAGPQLARLGDPDSDHDGIVDKMEEYFRLDPANADSDGDGICDGIEWGRIPTEQIDFVKRISILTGADLGEWPEAGTFDVTFAVTNAVAATTGLPSETNPFGGHAGVGWRVAAGSSLPPALVLTRTTGRLTGRLSAPGEHRFTIEHLDSAGALARQEFRLQVRPGLAVGAVGATIRVTTASDGNVRDDDLTLREALLLASGKLRFADLRPDPDPNDGKLGGEQVWVTGLPGIDSADTIELFRSPRLTSEEFFASESLGPLLMEGKGDHLKFQRTATLHAGIGPVLVLSGSDNRIDNALNFAGGTGAAVQVTGAGNLLSNLRFMGNGTGSAIELEGSGNRLSSLAIAGFATGFQVSGSHNVISNGTVTDCDDGIRLGAGSRQNLVEDVRVGFHPAKSTSEPARTAPNRGVGILISGGARDNRLQDCRVAACVLGGVRISGAGTELNQVSNCQVGDLAGGGTVPVGPNGRFGIAVAEGARSNRITGGLLSRNLGPGILLTDPGTEANAVEADPFRPFGTEIASTEPGIDALRVEGGASRNRVRTRITESRRDGVVLAGNGTRSNQVLAATIRKAAAAGVRIGAGASDNLLANSSVADSGTGLVLAGEGTRRNLVRDSSFTRNTGDGIQWLDGAAENHLGPRVSATDNLGNGLVAAGAATRGNVFAGETSSANQNTGHGIVFRAAAAANSASAVSLNNNRAGSVLFTGAGTTGNQVIDSFLSGGLFPADIALSGTGVTFSEGATANDVLRTSVSSHGRDGVAFLGSTTTSNRVANSNIGANLGAGVVVEGAVANRIGGEAGGNTITANGTEGIRITGAEAARNRVQGNAIGQNGSHGVLILDGAHDNRIGGPRVVRADPRSPSVLLRPTSFAEVGSGNRFYANTGDGIRVEGTGTRDNRIQGNFIGTGPSNTGAAIRLRAGATATRVGNAPRLDANNPRLGNLIGIHPAGTIRIEDAASRGNAIRRNEVLTTSVNPRLALVGGANGSPRTFSAEVDWPTGIIRGTAAAAGIVELFSDFVGDDAVYHLSARVGAGAFVIDSVQPALSENAALLDRQRPVRRGAQWVTFTELGTGATSAQQVIE